MGVWQQRHRARIVERAAQAHERLREAIERLSPILYDQHGDLINKMDEADWREYLHKQSCAQRKAQSKTAERQSRSSGANAIDNLLAFQLSYAAAKERVAGIDAELAAMDSTLDGPSQGNLFDRQFDLQEELKRKQKAMVQFSAKIESIRQYLQLNGDNHTRERLKNLRDEPLYRNLANLRILKSRIQASVRTRKFEHANMERGYRSQLMG